TYPDDRDISTPIWRKLMANATLKPLSARTKAKMVELCRFEPTKELVREMMVEVVNVASSLGRELPVSIERRLAGAERVGEHRTSMLQDLPAGGQLELEAWRGARMQRWAATRVPG